MAKNYIQPYIYRKKARAKMSASVAHRTDASAVIQSQKATSGTTATSAALAENKNNGGSCYRRHKT